MFSIEIQPKQRAAGSVLTIAICTTAIVGAALIVYLQLTVNQNQMTARSQVWNQCIPILEAGIEEALTHCNVNFETNMLSNGWQSLYGQYAKTNWIGKNRGLSKEMGYYEVAISQTLPYEIISRGYCPMPGSSTFISRTVKITTITNEYFTVSFLVREGVDMNGNNVKTDSFDSRDPYKSTLGKYDPTKAGDKGDMAAMGGMVNVGNADIWGHAYTSATGAVTWLQNGSVGSVAWHQAGKIGIEPGWWQNDLNISLPDIKKPFEGAPAPTGRTVAGVAYKYVLGDGGYQLPGITGGKILVNGNAVLYVTGDVVLDTSTDLLVIAPGASLKLYCAGANARFGTINNNATAPSFCYFGLPSNTLLKIGGNSFLTCTVYAPAADFVLNGSTQLSGSLVAKSARMTGNCGFHFDEACAGAIPPRKVLADSWNEL
jgi:hypothetical protein